MRTTSPLPSRESFVYTDPATGELRLRRYEVEVLGGPSHGAKRQVEGTCTVGSGPALGLLIEDPTVSRTHAELSARPDGLRIRDLGSRNGTFLDGVRVNDVVLLPDPEVVLTLGKSRLRIRLVDEHVGLSTEETSFGPMCGVSAAMRQLFAVAYRVAPTDVSVLITGEAGTGKRLLARTLHEHSLRAPGPFVTLDCEALGGPSGEAELASALSRAQGGTLFLDEVASLPSELQRRLLKSLEDGTGGADAKPLDLRVVSSHTRALAPEVEAGRFRADLAFRLGVVWLSIPALRDRPEDVPMLARRLAHERSGRQLELPDELVARLVRHGWPGNARELEAVVEQFLRGARIDLGRQASEAVQAGHQREVTAFFSDLSGFTRLSETLRKDLPKLKRVLDRYLSRITDVLVAHGGYVDKYVGDAVVCLFGAPQPLEKHALRACRAALNVQVELQRMGDELRAEGLPEMRIRIGLNTGEMLVGNIGRSELGEYTAIGDEMNVAARLEVANKAYGTGILVGQRTCELVRETFELRELDRVQVAGRDEPLVVYELLAERGGLDDARKTASELYARALEHYRAERFIEALPLLEKALRHFPGDGPAQRLARVCREWARRPRGSFSAVTVLEK